MLPNLRANARMVAPDLPDPAAVGYLLLLFDQCRSYELTHEQLVEVFGRPLLAYLDLSLQAVEKLAARSGIGKMQIGADAQCDKAEEEASPSPKRWLTPYQITRLRDLAGEYVAALPDERALEALLLIYDLFEIFALSPSQCETILGPGPLRKLTDLVYGERKREEAPEPQGAPGGEATQYDLPAQLPTLHFSGRAIPIVGTVGEGGAVTLAPEARLWLRYIGAPGQGPVTNNAALKNHATNGGAA
jgi:hypothetical protein